MTHKFIDPTIRICAEIAELEEIIANFDVTYSLIQRLRYKRRLAKLKCRKILHDILTKDIVYY